MTQTAPESAGSGYNPGMTAAPQRLPEPLQAFDPVSAALGQTLACVDELRTRYEAERSAGRILPNTIEAARIELTYHSNAIEGNTLSLRETQLVIEGHAPHGGKSLREIYEARNHDRALRTIEQSTTQRPPGQPLTVRDLLGLHAIIVDEIDAHAGQFRTERVLIAGTGFVPPGSHRFDELIPHLLDLAARPGVHPVIHAAELHYNIAAVHPFRDGNGRTARLLMNYELLRSGFPHTIIDVSQRGEYLAALDEANTGRWERFTRFVAESVIQSIKRVVGSQ